MNPMFAADEPQSVVLNNLLRSGQGPEVDKAVTSTLDEALILRGGDFWSPHAARSHAVGSALWCCVSMATLLPVFSHDLVDRGGATVADEWNLRGSRLWIHDFLQMMFWVGLTIGLPGWALFADAWGRRAAVRVSGSIGMAALVLSTLSPALWFYGVCRFFIGLSWGGCGMVAFILTSEWMATPSGRSFVGTIGLNAGYIAGELMVAGVASSYRGSDDSWWRGFTMIISAVAFVVFIPAAVAAPESPKWLLSRGYTVAAQDELDRGSVASIYPCWYFLRNQKLHNCSDSRAHPPRLKLNLYSSKSMPEATSSSFRSFFRDQNVGQATLALCCSWFAVAFAYFGLNQASANVVPSSMNVYISVVAMSIIEIPANVGAYFALESSRSLGRRAVCALSAGGGGLCCIMISFVLLFPENSATLASVSFFGLVGKLGVTMSFGIMYVE